MKFSTLEEIRDINRRHIIENGGKYVGPDNALNWGSLEWVLDAVRYPLFGIDHYPTLEEKAAILAWTIITGHVFVDGNKRTGMTALIHFVKLNHDQLDITTDEIVDVVIRIASAGAADSYQEFVHWVRSKHVPGLDRP